MTDFFDPEMFQTVNSAIDRLSSVLRAGKSMMDLAEEEPEKELALKQLSQAEKSIELAKVQMAQALGYTFCLCTFPPQIMLSQGRHPQGMEVFKCDKCGKQDPSQQYIDNLGTIDRYIDKIEKDRRAV